MRIGGILVLALSGCATAATQPITTNPDAAPPPSNEASARLPDASADAPAPPVSDADASASAPTPTASGCQTLSHGTSNVENSPADTYAWSDASCRPRSASLFRNDATDAFGEAGGYLRVLSYENAGTTRTCRGTGTNGWEGFGYVVDHYGSGASHTQHVLGTTSVPLAGKHHAVHQFKWRVYPGGTVDVTAEWRIATGRDHPIFAVTFDSSASGKNAVNADTRAPYGDMAYEGTAGAIGGVGWGDTHKFTTTSSPVTTSSSWDYTQPNTIPYDVSWSASVDAEMGLVATTDFSSGPSAGDYGGGLLQQSWGKSGTNLLSDLPDWLWPFQLNQYELPFGTTSHRVAWGASYGAVGQSSYSSLGRNLSGYPYTSYAVEVVFGAHQTSAVAAEVAEMETVLGTALSATKGTVSTSGPAPGRTDSVAFAHTGWDALRGAWSLDADQNEASVQMATGGNALVHPMFVVRGWTAGDPHLAWNGASLTPDVHYWATVDSARSELWITLAFAVTQGTLDVAP